jgi:hypothetical protein
MKRFTIFILGALFIGILMFRNLNSNSQKPIATENNQAAAQPIHDAPPAPKIISHNAVNQDSPTRAAWRERLMTFQTDTNDLFGASSEYRMKALQDFSESIPAIDLPEVLKELQTLQEQSRTASGHDLEMRLLKRWTENDAPSAAAWAGELTGDGREEALTAAASVWARKDFSAAIAWSDQLPEGPDRQETLKSIVSEALYSNPTDALKAASQLPPDSERGDLIARAAGAWAANAPADAVAWAKQQPDASARTQALAAIAIAWADRDPIAAGNLAVNSLPPGKTQEDAVFAVLRRWSLQDKNAAETWVAQFPEGELKTLARETLATDSKRLSAVVPTD